MSKTNQTDKTKTSKVDFTTMSPKAIFDHFGGEMSRGGVSRTIRELAACGYTRGAITKLTGKRYQHVRNVLVEAAKRS